MEEELILINQLANLVKPITPKYETITENITIKLLLNKFCLLEESKQFHKIRNFPIKSSVEFLVSIRCIINNKKIKRPARTLKCTHIECMELVNLFSYVLKFGKCPLCSLDDETNKNIYQKNISNINSQTQPLSVNSIYVDSFFEKLFSEIENNNYGNYGFEFIIINKNTNKWRPYDPTKKQEEINSKYFLEEINNEYLIEGHLEELVEINNFIGKEENQIRFQKLN